MLSAAELEAFERDGFVVIRGAVPAGVAADCAAVIHAQLARSGVDAEDPTTWSAPVVRIACPFGPAFASAGTQPVLWEAYDQLLGPGTWTRLPGIGGTVPIRFPHPDDPGDAGWHVDGGFAGEGGYRLNLASRGRALLCLFLLSAVGPDDAPTEIKVGSHLDVPPLLAGHGDDGLSFMELAAALPGSTFARPSAFATGDAGDVFVCHPFLVHRATWPHRGLRPRIMAQPGVVIPGSLDLDGAPTSPVVAAIRRGLAGA